VERRPDPPPLETNDVAVIATGTVLWFVALVVVLVLKAAGVHIHGWWWQMCAAGGVLGCYGVHYTRKRRRSLGVAAGGALDDGR
jgi:hypothetical protein